MKDLQLGRATSKAELLQQRVHHVFDLSFAKVAAHIHDPATYPLPQNKKSIEYAMHNLYLAVPKNKQKDFLAQASTIFQSDTTERKRKFGDLADLDLKSRQPIAEQAKKLNLPEHLKFSADELHDLDLAAKKHGVAPHRKIAPQHPVATRGNQRTLQLAVDKITCVATQERRKDEILLKGFFTDSLGETTTFNQIDVGDFKDGENIPLGDKGILANFDLNAAGTFPQTFTAGFFVIEKDLIANQDLVDRIILAMSITYGVLAGIAVVLLITGLALIGAGQIYAGGTVMMAMLVVGIIAGLTMTLTLIFKNTFGGDFGTAITDVFTFDLNPLTLQIGEAEVHTKETTILGITLKRSGHYNVDIKWLRTA